MGKSQRDKGARGERKMIEKLESIGIKALRTSNSGAAFTITKNKGMAASYRGDLFCQLEGWHFNAEVKARADDAGWKCIKDWLADADMLFICEDRKQPLCVLPFHILTTLVDMVKRTDSTLEALAPLDERPE